MIFSEGCRRMQGSILSLWVSRIPPSQNFAGRHSAVYVGAGAAKDVLDGSNRTVEVTYPSNRL